MNRNCVVKVQSIVRMSVQKQPSEQISNSFVVYSDWFSYFAKGFATSFSSEIIRCNFVQN